MCLQTDTKTKACGPVGKTIINKLSQQSDKSSQVQSAAFQLHFIGAKSLLWKKKYLLVVQPRYKCVQQRCKNYRNDHGNTYKTQIYSFIFVGPKRSISIIKRHELTMLLTQTVHGQMLFFCHLGQSVMVLAP